MSYYTGDTMSGYIQITPKNLTTDINEVTVTLKVPGKYLREVSILTSIVPQHTINQRLQKLVMITKLLLRFNNYQKSEVLTLPLLKI